jgi:hypothetical protein
VELAAQAQNNPEISLLTDFLARAERGLIR